LVTVSTRPEPGSRVTLEIEVPAAEVDRHFATAYRHVAERTKVPGFRPGKAPRHVIDRFVGHGSVVAEAIDHLVGEAYDAAIDQSSIIPIDQPQVEIDSTAVSEGVSVRFTATVAVRPEVTLGAYTGYPFGLEPAEVTDEQVEAVVNDLREQQATLRPIDGRGAATGDMVAVKFNGTIDGEPFEGGSADRLPLVIGEERMVPGWEEQLIGLHIDEAKEFEVDFPDDYRVEALRGKRARFEVTLLDRRERLLPEQDDEFAKSVSDGQTMDDLRTEIRDALQRREEEETRHRFADRIVDFAVANATVELPEVMIANEIEVMRDELGNRLAAQRIGMEQYLELARQTPEELAAEMREPASRRVKSLLVLSAIAEQEGIDASDDEIDAEIRDQLARYGDEPRLSEYLGSRRGRSYLRMTLRNRTLVDSLIKRASELATTESATKSATEPAAAINESE
jgi:trigger factor